MSTSVSLAPTAPWPSPDAGGPAGHDEARELGGPGHLRIDARVVQKLAARAADEVDGVTRASVAPLSRAVHHPVPASTPRDQVAIDLDVSVCVQYPRPVRTVVEDLAAHLSRRVEQLSGRPVGRVHVRVRGLGDDEGADRPRVR